MLANNKIKADQMKVKIAIQLRKCDIISEEAPVDSVDCLVKATV
jgi:hypothetical protein